MEIVNKTKILIAGSVAVIFFVLCGFVFASSFSQLNVEPMNDFVLEPGKVEVFLNPGETVIKNMSVTSRVKGVVNFKIETEDFIGSRQEDKPIILLGGDKSPYSFKDIIAPDIKTFSLNFGQRITIPVKISIPKDAEAGGFYSSVLISNQPSKDLEQANTKVVSRLGTLFFIRVKGQTNESGNLEDFRIAGGKKLFYENSPIKFQILFNNNGTVHTIPFGAISIKNIFNKVIADVPVDAYFSLPDSLRYRDISWNGGNLIGRYTATVYLNRGYGGIVDEKTLVFWVIPWKIIIIVFGSVLVLFSGIYFLFKKFELKVRS